MLKLEGSELIVVMANQAALDLYSSKKEVFIGQSIYSFNQFPEEKFIELETSNSIRTTFNLISTDRKLKIIEIVINKLEEGANDFIALMIDKTDEALFEKQKFDLINQAEEKEKKNIARELHDGLGQQLVLLNKPLPPSVTTRLYRHAAASLYCALHAHFCNSFQFAFE